MASRLGSGSGINSGGSVAALQLSPEECAEAFHRLDGPLYKVSRGT
jgi:hypothetical protein